jgi:hypothetical protein
MDLESVRARYIASALAGKPALPSNGRLDAVSGIAGTVSREGTL